MRDDRDTVELPRVPQTRRRWLGGAAALAGLSLLPRVARADRYGPEGGTRILVIGDSMIAGGFGLYLARSLGVQRGYDATRRGKTSSGLARPDFFDWMEEARVLVGGAPFDASVVMFGGNDAQGLFMGKGDQGHSQWIRWADDGWAEEYARRVVALCDVLAPQRQQVFWVGMPVMKPPKFNERMRRVNTIYRAEMAIRPKAKFIDIWSRLADEHGDYSDRIHLAPEGQSAAGSPSKRGRRRKKTQVRAGDGIHLTVAGARYLADHVEAIVHERLSAPE